MFLYVFNMFFTHSFQILHQKIKLQELPQARPAHCFTGMYNNLTFGLCGISVLQYLM